MSKINLNFIKESGDFENCEFIAERIYYRCLLYRISDGKEDGYNDRYCVVRGVPESMDTFPSDDSGLIHYFDHREDAIEFVKKINKESKYKKPWLQ